MVIFLPKNIQMEVVGVKNGKSLGKFVHIFGSEQFRGKSFPVPLFLGLASYDVLFDKGKDLLTNLCYCLICLNSK